MILLGHVAQLWRYPVKSMQGEPCTTLAVDALGIDGDRRFAFESADAPIGKPLLRSVQRASMLHARATLSGEDEVLVQTASGTVSAIRDPGLAAQLGGVTSPASAHLHLRHSPRPFTDVRPIALHSVATEAALAREFGSFDPRRLRSNLVLDLAAGPFAEDALTGSLLRIGATADLRLLERIPRCRMVSLDPETAAPDPTLLRALARSHEGKVGVYARAVTPGTLSLGDPVHLLSACGPA